MGFETSNEMMPLSKMKEIKLRERTASTINPDGIIEALRSRQASRRAVERPAPLTDRYRNIDQPPIAMEADNPLQSLQAFNSGRKHYLTGPRNIGGGFEDTIHTQISSPTLKNPLSKTS